LSRGEETPDGTSRSALVEQLARREAPRLLSFFTRRVTSPDDAADLVGETLVVLWRRERSVPADPTEARMWMFGVAQRVLSQHRRSATRSRELGERLAREVRATTIDASPDGFEDLRTAIAALRDPDKEIIRLVYWDGFTLVETARLLGMNAATVRSRHSRARASLQAHLEATTIATPR
jgi:RNA polymerase sigma-70 factor (ECF subfamily)